MEKILENINELKNHINVVYNTYNTDLFKYAFQLYTDNDIMITTLKTHSRFVRLLRNVVFELYP